ncbi:MAG: ribosome-associated translation inhibitor RaiA [Desulfobacula sp.]|jgi:ribosomal subunit interface protein
MNIQITTDNLEITPTFKKLIEKKLEKLDKLLVDFDKDQKTALVHITKDKYDQFTANLDMHLPNKNGHIFAKDTNKNLLSAVIAIREQIEKQIKKYKSDLVNYSLG